MFFSLYSRTILFPTCIKHGCTDPKSPDTEPTIFCPVAPNIFSTIIASPLPPNTEKYALVHTHLEETIR